MDNHNKNFSCDFAEMLVSHLYDDVTADERIRFERHLAECVSCSDEFSGISAVRKSVMEWREVDFSELPLPRIELQYAEPRFAIKSASLLEHLAGLLSLTPRWAAAGVSLTALLILAGAIFIASRFDGAVESSKVDVGEPERTGITEIAVNGQYVDNNTSNSKIEKIGSSGDVAADSAKDPRFDEKRGKSTRRSSERKIAPNKQNAVRVADRMDPFIPRLNDFEDYHDDSLRLSDLVAEIDGGK